MEESEHNKITFFLGAVPEEFMIGCRIVGFFDLFVKLYFCRFRLIKKLITTSDYSKVQTTIY